jgi:hypothetical protein
MNIFKILSSGNGSIKEPNISSFLGYLLDPGQEHGLKDGFLKTLIDPLILESGVESLIISRDSVVVNLTNESAYTANVILEAKVELQTSKYRFIDIVVEILNKEKEVIFLVCIENKIRGGSVTEGQLNEQLEGIKTKDKYKGVGIGYIYLTPDSSGKCKEEYKSFVEKNKDIPAKHVFWKGHDDSIYNLLVEMLKQESIGKIEPIFEYSKYTIKSFLNFIDTNFQSYVEEKRNVNITLDYKKPIGEYIKDIRNTLDEDQKITVEDLKKSIVSLVKEATGLEINRGTLNAQVYKSIVNEKNRLHYNINRNNHHNFDLFYYVNDDKKIVQRFSEDSVNNIDIIYKDV